MRIYVIFLVKIWIFIALWISGCLIVDYAFPNIQNSYQMTVGYILGTVSLNLCGILRQ